MSATKTRRAGVIDPARAVRAVSLSSDVVRDAATAALDGLLKDLRLAASEAVDVDTALLAALGDLFAKASDAGHGDEDIAAVYQAL